MSKLLNILNHIVDRVDIVIAHYHEYIPFIALTGNGKITMNFARVIEALIIGVLAGVFAGYISIKQMEVKMAALEAKVSGIERDIKDMREDIYKPAFEK